MSFNELSGQFREKAKAISRMITIPTAGITENAPKSIQVLASPAVRTKLPDFTSNLDYVKNAVWEETGLRLVNSLEAEQ